MTATDDDDLIARVPVGDRYALIAAALTKRCLQAKPITVGQKLRLLELLNGLTDLWFTADMLAMIQPMSNVEYEIYQQAASLDPDDRCTESFKILTSARVFGHFVTLNPSILAAIEHHEAQFRPATLTNDEVPAYKAEIAKPINGEIPARFFPRTGRPEFARGTPGHPAGSFDVHTGTQK